MNRTPFIVLALVLLFFASTKSISSKPAEDPKPESTEIESASSKHFDLYKELGLEKEFSFQAFMQAMLGYERIKPSKPILTLIDFSKASTDERLYVININKKKILFKSVVAHGKNSGENYTTSFSNEPGSKQSSLGFFVTEKTYIGGNGYSLIIDGLEKDINHNAKKRAIVIHGADYADPKKAKNTGRLGRSWGCPALPKNINKDIIDTIKGGSLIYAYSEKHNKDYLKKSKIIPSD